MQIISKPLNMQTAQLFKDWADKLLQFINAHGQTYFVRVIEDVMSKNDTFANIVNDAINRNGNASKAIEEWAKTSAPEAIRLKRAATMLPMTISGLQLGIECIRATARDTHGIDFDNLDYETVRDYCAVIIDMTQG